MSKYVMLWKWTEKGAAELHNSPDRADAFVATAKRLGAKVESFLWTAGPYDGLAIIEAPDHETISALSLATAKLGNIATTTLRAYTADEFRKVVKKIG